MITSVQGTLVVAVQETLVVACKVKRHSLKMI